MKNRNCLHKIQNIFYGAGILFLPLTLIYGRAGWTFLILGLGLSFILEAFFKFRENRKFNPYYLMILSPFLLINYSSPTDFRIRFVCFFIFIYIFSVAHKTSGKRLKFSLMKTKLVIIWFLAFSLFSLASVILFLQGINLSGDEPHFIMISQSIVEDGDFDLKNNFMNKTYYKYLPIDIHFHGGIHRGKYLSFHMPGVSFLLVPFYTLYELMDGFIPAALYFRLAASLINAFFALGLFYILKITFPRKDFTGIWLLLLILFPVLFQSVHIFPELPAATLIMAAYIFSFSENKNYFWAGFFLSLALWFHVKYYPVIGIMAVIILIRMSKEEGKIKNFITFIISPLLNLILLVIFSNNLYGTFSPTGIFPRQDFLAPPLLLRIKVFFAYFLDQRDGLLFYNPLLFLSFLGLKNKIKNQAILLWIAIPYIVFHALTTVRGAYSPAGRPVMFVSWIFIIFLVNYYYQNEPKQSRYTFKLLAGFALFILVWLIYYPLFIYQPVVSSTIDRASSFLKFMGSNLINLPKLFPSFLTIPPDFHIANALWLLGLTAALALYYMRYPRLFLSKNQKTLLTGFVFLTFTTLFCFFPHIQLIPKNRFSDNHISLYNNSGNFRYIETKKGFNLLAGNTYQIFIEPNRPLKEALSFQFQNTERVDVQVYNKTRLLYFSRKKGREGFSIPFFRLKTLKVKKKKVIPIEITTSTREKQAFLFLQIK